MVELRTSMSISPDCSARKRCWAESGTYLALVASPRTAAATALHMSISRPDHLPWLSASENPPSPTLTPQTSWPRFLTVSSVDSADAVAVQPTNAPKIAPPMRIRVMTDMEIPLVELLALLAPAAGGCNECFTAICSD